MSYKTPTRRRKKKEQEGLNLIPILDSVFIFIFFLLMSAQFINVKEIGSNVPMVSNVPPPKTKEKPLALTLTITKSALVMSQGIPTRRFAKVEATEEGYNYEKLHDLLVGLKKKYPHEKDIIFMAKHDLDYEGLIKIMDAVRLFRPTDEKIYFKDKDGIDVVQTLLFNKIAFGNLTD